MKISYFKLAIQMLRSNWFFSMLSITAIAFTVMIVLVISMQYEMAIVSQAPEVNLDRMVVLQRATIKYTERGGMTSSYLGARLVDTLKANLKVPVAISQQSSTDWNFVGEEGVSTYTLISTDADYWIINKFSFLKGRSFSEEEVASQAKVIVLSEKLAKCLFPKQEPLGRTVEISGVPFMVVGVVSDVSSTCRFAFGELWVPYSSNRIMDYDNMMEEPYLGSYTLLIMGKSSNDIDAIKAEVKGEVARLASSFPKGHEFFVPGPDTSFENFFRGWDPNLNPDSLMSWLQILARLIGVMLIPALNLIAINLTWIGERASEIGLRKAFGATRLTLVKQLLTENTIVTLLGGFIGLLLALGCASIFRDMLFRPEYGSQSAMVNVSISVMPFVVTILSCFLLSILSGLIPALKITKTEPALVLKGGVR